MAAAVIMPRIPPLSRKPDTYSPGATPAEEEVIQPHGALGVGGCTKPSARRASTGSKLLPSGRLQNIVDLWIGVIPVVMAIGTLAVAIATYTPIFKWLGLPFIPLLQLLGIPEAEAASQTILVGFADMFLPTVLASGITSDMTRFVIAALSVTQLIYMSEVGGLLLGSKLPVSFKDLVVIFLLRTLLTLPIIAMIAHLLF